MEKHNTQELRSISDGQKNTLAKDQSKMIDAELVGLPEGKFKQKPETTIYSTIIQSQLSSSEKQEDQSQPLNNKGKSLKKNNFDIDEDTGWVTTLSSDDSQNDRQHERISKSTKNDNDSLEIQFEKTQPNPQTNSHYKSFLNELIRKSAERKSVQNLANVLETDNILSSGNSQSVMINKSLYHLNGRAGIITNVTPETRHNIDKTTGSNINR
ncbi:hypothetical protein HU257_04560 [Enterococcus hirae]|uniref:hypothetical protein n=1 Tax=Enterococcus TaxID=1350 RepID=UPI00159810F1|nr:hypothetical protein [Enterococcus hirae]QKX70942.1 hypothetical protein HU257_04560 [Enterococcus hirae]